MNNGNFPLKEISIKELYMPASECIYEIPIYQRNYAWEYDEIATLIQDIYDKFEKSKDRNYYIGTLVSYKKDENVYEVIDGQQRLTTIRIILGVLYNFDEQNTVLLSHPLTGKLTFRAREKSDEALSNIPSNSSEKRNNKRNETTAIDVGFKHATTKLKEILNNKQVSISDFIVFFLNKVHLIHYQVPADIDLNHYFEIMNSRGEQLEKHEIVKAKIIEIFSGENNKRKIVNEIWNDCSQMNVYIQRMLHEHNFDDKTSYATVIFGEDFNSYSLTASKDSESEFDTIINKILNLKNKINTGTKQKISLQDILDNKYKADDTDRTKKYFTPSFQPIIDFPNFLLIVLKITELQVQDNKLAALDDKELLKAFDDFLELSDSESIRRKRAEKFIINLIKVRYFLDNFIVHHNLETEELTSNPWKLEKYCKRDKDDVEYSPENLVNDTLIQDELRQLLSMFEVTYSARQRKNYLFYCLYYLIKKWHFDKADCNYVNYLNFVKNLAYYYFNYIYLIDVKKMQTDDDSESELKAADYLNYNFDKSILDSHKIDSLDSAEFIKDNPQRTIYDFEAVYGNGKTTASNSKECNAIPLFIFNYLDYKIWKYYYNNARGEDKNKKPFYELIGININNESESSRFNKFLDKFNNFYFSRSRKSLEHYLPQTNEKNINDNNYQIKINCLGNYAMIGGSANSSGSNWDPLTKISHYLDSSRKIDPVSISSLKFMIMMRICDSSDNGWGQEQIKNHHRKMLDMLFKNI